FGFILFFLCFMLFSFSGNMIFAVDDEVTVNDETELTIEQLKEDNEKINEALEQAKKNAADANTQQAIYAEKVLNLQSQIDILNTRISSYKRVVDSTNNQMAMLQKSIDEKESALENIVRSVYMLGDSYFIDFLFSSKSFSEFLDNQMIITRATQYYTQLVYDLKQEKVQLSETQKKVELTYQDLKDSREDLGRQRTELAKSLKEQQELLRASTGEQVLLLDNLNMNNEYIKELDRKLEEYYQSINNNNNQSAVSSAADSSTATESIVVEEEIEKQQKEREEKKEESQNSTNGSEIELLWPVPGFLEVSSYWGDGRNHQGTDIAGYGIYGAEIVAAASGKVIQVNSDGSWGGGYGNYVVIDHGGTLSTLYAHMSGVEVKEGQSVAQGEVIGYVGSTGDSTGPHLHYEVRVNGVRVDPLGYYD
ncbi:MAG: peptidoglycan DD-metalloendopeptidase family protein, partial [Clostridia bacterium]|nr:peptidoglycan DD-metalloendopeptidase family protein [Clostridia bacterium]